MQINEEFVFIEHFLSIPQFVAGVTTVSCLIS